MKRPSVAVVIPSYNHGRYMAETLRAVFQQTRPPDEVHVIDDGSTDDSVRVIESAFADAGPVRCSLKVRENRGISATRNELIEGVSTDFVAFLDSDDLYAPNRLERMLDGAPRDGLYFAVSGVDFLSELGDDVLEDWQLTYRMIIGQAMAFPTAGFAVLRSNFPITTSNFVMSRKLLDAVGGFDQQIAICQDWDYAIRASRFVEPTFVPERLLTYRLHPLNTSRNVLETADREIDLVNRKLPEWAMEATVNPLAPTLRNWPRFFRVFAYLSRSAQCRPIAAWMTPEVLATARPPGSVAGDRESEAIRRVIAMARSPESFDGLSTTDLLLGCQRAWNSHV